MENNLAVSVIIPLYNAEKYIGECLDSILAQTFQNFEVIIIDDCSTDNSFEIVKSFIPKFGERLTLTETKSNSGGGGYVPRNIGLKLSRGEFIFFVDVDDFIAENALETLHKAATQYNADVVYTGAFYHYLSKEKFGVMTDAEGTLAKEKGLKDKITLTIDDPNKNLQRLFFDGCFRNPWTKFVRRKFLLENKIEFPKIISGGDFIWTIHVFSCSKRFLRIPNACYFYRANSCDSVTRKNRSHEKQLSTWLKAFVLWTEALDKVSSEIDILKQNPLYCYTATEQHFSLVFNRILSERIQLEPYVIYELLQREFTDKGGVYVHLIPYLFSLVNAQQRKFLEVQQRVSSLEKVNRENKAYISELENFILKSSNLKTN